MVGLVVATGTLAGVKISERRAVEAACAGGNTQGAPPRAARGDTPAAIIGDSWASGYGLADPADSFAYRLARLRRWNAVVSAVAGTGFSTSGVCGDGRDYASRIPVVPTDAEVVLIEGGLNDVASDDLTTHAVGVIEGAKRQAPGALVVVVGPPHVPLRAPNDIRTTDKALRVAADRTGAHYVSTLQWSIPTSDDLHPTPAGHAAFASHLADELSALSAQ